MTPLSNGKTPQARSTALLIDGAHCVGKSYIAEEFARENYKSYILIDFNQVGKEVTDLFINYLDDLDMLLFDKLSVNNGMLMENMVAQMLTAAGYRLYFFSKSSRENADERMEIDFLIARAR